MKKVGYKELWFKNTNKKAETALLMELFYQITTTHLFAKTLREKYWQMLCQCQPT